MYLRYGINILQKKICCDVHARNRLLKIREKIR